MTMSREQFEAEKEHILELQREKSSKGELEKGTQDWYSRVIPQAQPLYEDLHNDTILHYREAKRQDYNTFDEFGVKIGTPLSASEHNFHNVGRGMDYDKQRVKYEQEKKEFNQESGFNKDKNFQDQFEWQREKEQKKEMENLNLARLPSQKTTDLQQNQSDFTSNAKQNWIQFQLNRKTLSSLIFKLKAELRCSSTTSQLKQRNKRNFARFYMRPLNVNPPKVNDLDQYSKQDSFSGMNVNFGGELQMEKLNIKELRYLTDLDDHNLEKINGQNSNSNNGNLTNNKISARDPQSSQSQFISEYDDYNDSAKTSQLSLNSNDRKSGYTDPTLQQEDGTKVSYKV
eukprot:403353441